MLRAPSAELTNVDGQMPVVEEGIAAIRHQLECSKLLNPPSGRAVARLSLPLARALSSLWPAAAARATLASAQSIARTWGQAPQVGPRRVPGGWVEPHCTLLNAAVAALMLRLSDARTDGLAS
jgi:hypothetical protein